MKPFGPHNSLAAAVSVCARCSAAGGTCCRCQPGEEDVFAPVSRDELVLIVAAMPQADAAELFVPAPNSEIFVQHMLRLFPGRGDRVVRLYPRGGTHVRLATALENRCVLLGDAGCRLPRESRPLFCRLYPFWFSGPDQLCLFSSDRCLALREHTTLPALCRALGTEREELGRLYLSLCRAWDLTP